MIRNLLNKNYLPYIKKIETINKNMDQKYKEVSSIYGFECKGCDDNCCKSLFYHYTLIEYLYLFIGFNSLNETEKIDIKKDANRVYMKNRLMCPLNIDGSCRLYNYRPMICRLHGIAYQFKKPNGDIVYGQGCMIFDLQYRTKNNLLFDRTLFYLQIAETEKMLKEELQVPYKIKMTVSDIILSF